MSASFTNQVLAQIELHAHAEAYGLEVVTCPSCSTRRSPGCISMPSACG